MANTDVASPPVDLTHFLDLYRSQFALRKFEERAYDLFLESFVKGTSHLSIGQEAIAAGFAAAMRPRTGRSRPTAVTRTPSRAASR